VYISLICNSGLKWLADVDWNASSWKKHPRSHTATAAVTSGYKHGQWQSFAVNRLRASPVLCHTQTDRELFMWLRTTLSQSAVLCLIAPSWRLHAISNHAAQQQ
jgi:hypothetical protein